MKICESTKLTMTIGQLKRLLKEVSEIDITVYLRRSLERIRDVTKRKDDGWHSIGGHDVQEINWECENSLELIGHPNVKEPDPDITDTFERIQAMTDRSVFDSWMPIPGEMVREINDVCERTLSKIQNG